MTDATEAARRLLSSFSRPLSRGEVLVFESDDVVAVARALLAGHDETVERCAQIADRRGAYARADIEGGPHSQTAAATAEGLAKDIRALKTGTKP